MASDDANSPEENIPSEKENPKRELDPNITAGVGLAMGGVIGLGLGLKAEHDAEQQGTAVSWLTKAAIIRGAIGLGVLMIALIVFVAIITTHNGTNNGPSFINACKAIPKPGPSWHCVGGDWISSTP
jgi:hypothetical protein